MKLVTRSESFFVIFVFYICAHAKFMFIEKARATRKLINYAWRDIYRFDFIYPSN